MMNNEYKLVNADLVRIEDDKGNVIYISPTHPKYKELVKNE